MADTEGLGANQNLFIFECNSETYMGCMEHQLFGSNKPWPLQVKFGDYLLLHHIELVPCSACGKRHPTENRTLSPRPGVGASHIRSEFNL